jgi:predicted transposase/invertase (TIGR01784 family)
MAKFRRLGKKDIKQNPLHRWLSYFDKDSPPEIVEEVIRMDQAIEKAQEKVRHVCLDKEALRAYKMREMALSDWTSGVNHARMEGLQEGRTEGREEGQEIKAIEIARKALSEGVSAEFVRKITGLDLETIKNISGN